MYKNKLRILLFPTTEELNPIYSTFCPVHHHTHAHPSTWQRVGTQQVLNFITPLLKALLRLPTGPGMRFL